jgi:predicted nucleotidyltransferase
MTAASEKNRRAMGSAIDDPIMKRFRAALDKLYGERIERVVLFGSRARGDVHEDSDYDIAVFLNDLTDRWLEVHRIIPIVTDILYGTKPSSMPCLTARAPTRSARL